MPLEGESGRRLSRRGRGRQACFSGMSGLSTARDTPAGGDLHYNACMARALLVVGIGILLGGLIAWMVISSTPPAAPNQPDAFGIRPPQTARPPGR